MTSIDNFCALFKACKNKKIPKGKRALTGQLKLDEHLLDLLNLAESQGFFSGVVKSIDRKRITNLKKSADILIGQDIEFELNFENLQVYEDWDAFFKNSKNRACLNEEFALLSEKCAVFSPSSRDETYLKYFNVVKVLMILNSAKDHSDGTDLWVFSRRSKLELEVRYSKEDLDNADLDCHSLFLQTMKDEDNHLDEKRSIIQEVLAKMLCSKSPVDRCPWLLRHFKEFFIQFEYSYRMFASNFSFDKLRKEYEEQYRDFSVKLNSTLSDLSTKALAVPAALIFSISKFESDMAVKSAALLNWLMASGVTLISFLILFLTIAHWHSLSAIKVEYGGLMNRLFMELDSNDSVDATNIGSLLEQLDTRTFVVRCLLIAISVVALVSPLIAIGYALHLHI